MRSVLFTCLLQVAVFFSFGQVKGGEGGQVKAGGREGYADCGAVRLHYTVFGKGYPLVIINGGPGMNSEGFAGLARQLGESNQVIIYDQRGTGRSTMARIDSSTMTMRLMAGDLECLRKHLGIGEWIILGHSFGGMLGSYYTTLYPENVRALILSSSGGIDLKLLSGPNGIQARLTKEQSDSVNYWAGRIASGDTSYYARLQRGRNLGNAYIYDKKNLPVIAERLTQGNMTINGLLWQDMRKIHFDCRAGLQNFRQPVLILQGTDDILSRQIALDEHKALSNSSLVFLERCGHYGWLDRPDLYYPLIGKFVKGLL